MLIAKNQKDRLEVAYVVLLLIGSERDNSNNSSATEQPVSEHSVEKSEPESVEPSSPAPATHATDDYVLNIDQAKAVTRRMG